MMHFILWAALLVACSRSPERTRTFEAAIVEVTGNGAFGSIPVGESSDPHTFVVRPAPPADSLQDDQIEAITSTCSEFKVQNPLPGLPPNPNGPPVFRRCTEFGGEQYGGTGPTRCISFVEQTYAFDVRFVPNVELPSSSQCKVVVRMFGGLTYNILVSGTGVAPRKRVTITPTGEINFRSIRQTQTSLPKTITITNTGSESNDISATVSTANGVFEIQGALSTSIPPNGGTHTYSIKCRPNVADPNPTDYTGSITLATQDPNKPTVNFPLKCRGINHPLDPSTLVSEISTRVGEPKTITIDVGNVAATAVSFGDIQLSADAAPGLSIMTKPGIGDSLDPNATTQIVLRWDPPAPYSDGLGAVIIPVQGEPVDFDFAIPTGTAKLADVRSSDSRIGFGKLCIGDSKTLKFTMQPGGSDTVALTGYTVTGVTAPPPFTATVNGSSDVQLLPVATEVSIDVTALETISDGVFEQNLVVETDSPTEGTYEIPLAVKILQAGATVDPPLLDFKRINVTGYSESKPVTFNNCTPGNITVTGISLDGASAADFRLVRINANGVEQLPPFELPRNAEVTMDVQMLPQTGGVKAAQLIVDYQKPGAPATDSETVALSGEGFAGDPARDSYYRCSTGAPVHLLPLLLVGMWLVMRRRRAR